MNPKLIKITFKTKTGVYVSESISNSDSKSVIEKDRDVIKRCFRDKLEGFKKEMIINQTTKLPLVISVDFIKDLGL